VPLFIFYFSVRKTISNLEILITVFNFHVRLVTRLI
jgi:hypothetical protein